MLLRACSYNRVPFAGTVDGTTSDCEQQSTLLTLIIIICNSNAAKSDRNHSMATSISISDAQPQSHRGERGQEKKSQWLCSQSWYVAGFVRAGTMFLLASRMLLVEGSTDFHYVPANRESCDSLLGKFDASSAILSINMQYVLVAAMAFKSDINAMG